MKLNYWTHIESGEWKEFKNTQEALEFFIFEMGFDYVKFYYPERTELDRIYSIWCDVTEEKVDYKKVLDEKTIYSVWNFTNYALDRANQYRDQYQNQ